MVDSEKCMLSSGPASYYCLCKNIYIFFMKLLGIYEQKSSYRDSGQLLVNSQSELPSTHWFSHVFGFKFFQYSLIVIFPFVSHGLSDFSSLPPSLFSALPSPSNYKLCSILSTVRAGK